jgi:hypothetical protein
MKVQILKKIFTAISISTSLSVTAFVQSEEHNKNCLNCHKEGKANYDHTAHFYDTRSLGKLKNFADLKAQINRCSNYYDSAWWPEEEVKIVKYLNGEYYQFAINTKSMR